MLSWVLCAANASHAQVPLSNASFEQRDAGSSTGMLGWEAAAGNKAVFEAEAQRPWGGKGTSLKVSLHGDVGVGDFIQEIPFSSEGIARYRIRCAIRCEGVKVRAGVGARVYDAAGNTMTARMALSVTGTKGWRRMEGDFFVDSTAARLRVFGLLRGEGTLWLDDVGITRVPPSPDPVAAKVRGQVDAYFSLVRASTVVKDTAYLNRLERATLSLCRGMRTVRECDQVLARYTTFKLNDGHSFFTTRSQWKEMNQGGGSQMAGLLSFPTGHLRQDGIAYVQVPTFVSVEEDKMHAYADTLQALLAAMDAQGPKGWIIDLRGNEGGNSFPMVAGVGPLLGEGMCRLSVNGDGSVRRYLYQGGRAGWEGGDGFQKVNPVTLRNAKAPIAVLQSQNTGSSGEVVLLCFRGMDNVRLFGQPSAGANTRVDNLLLPNGSRINLASGFNADRNGQTFGGPIPPDVEAADEATALQGAVEWILSR